MPPPVFSSRMTPACPGFTSLSNVITNSATALIVSVILFTSAFHPFPCISCLTTPYVRLLSYYAHTLSAVKGIFRCRCEHERPEDHFGRDDDSSASSSVCQVRRICLHCNSRHGSVLPRQPSIPNCFSRGHRNSLIICTRHRIGRIWFQNAAAQKC